MESMQFEEVYLPREATRAVIFVKLSELVTAKAPPSEEARPSLLVCAI